MGTFTQSIHKRIFLDIFLMACYWIDELLSLVIQTSVLLKNAIVRNPMQNLGSAFSKAYEFTMIFIT